MHRSQVLLTPLIVAVGLLAGAPARAQLGDSRVGLRVQTLTETDAAHAGTTLRVALDVRLARGFHVQSNEPADEFLIPTVLELEPPARIEVAGLAYPEPMTMMQGGTLELLVYEEHFFIGAALDLADDLAPGDYTVPGTLQYQACDETMCFAPRKEPVQFSFAVVPASRSLTRSHADVFAGMRFADAAADVANDGAAATPSAGTAAETATDADHVLVAEDADVLETLDGFDVLATTGGYQGADDFLAFIDAAESGRPQRGLFEGRGPLAIVLLTLLGGLALNLTPCVLPMIPINLAIIGAGAEAGSRGRGFALGAAYGAAMALVYGVLGLVVVLTAGTFGTINASPWFNLGIAVLFVVLTLAMFDVITIDFSRFQPRMGGGANKGTFLLAFGMGGVAALLAGACVAPVVIQVVVFSGALYARGVALALALPFLLGVGMAIPWPLAGAGLAWLPKPGPWMVRVKQVMGLFILAMAAYYGSLAYGLFAQRWVDPEEVTGSVQELVAAGWYPTLSQGLEAARREDKLVLVDMWATWCKNCLVMDETTLRDPDVQAALENYVKVKFQAEDLNASPAREVMRRFDAVGLPAYAILRAGSPD